MFPIVSVFDRSFSKHAIICDDIYTIQRHSLSVHSLPHSNPSESFDKKKTKNKCRYGHQLFQLAAKGLGTAAAAQKETSATDGDGDENHKCQGDGDINTNGDSDPVQQALSREPSYQHLADLAAGAVPVLV